MNKQREPYVCTRRHYLIAQAMCADPAPGIFLAVEAVATTAIEHPDWDMEEVKQWTEWEKEYGRIN